MVRQERRKALHCSDPTDERCPLLARHRPDADKDGKGNTMKRPLSHPQGGRLVLCNKPEV